MQIIPAIDLLGGEAARLERGDYDRVLFRRPAVELVAAAAALSPPRIHLVDLDGARSGRLNLAALGECVAAAGRIPVQVSGGIRDLDTALSVLGLGADRVLIGTAAFESPERLSEFADRLGERLAVSVDVRDGRVRVSGWTSSTGLGVPEAVERCLTAGVTRVVATSIARDGTLEGPDLALYRELCSYPLRVIAAGGVRDRRDVEALAEIGCEGAITGRAFAEGAFDEGPVSFGS